MVQKRTSGDSSAKLSETKYCYHCGKSYVGEQCQACYSTIYTDKPNRMTEIKKDTDAMTLDLTDVSCPISEIESGVNPFTGTNPVWGDNSHGCYGEVYIRKDKR